MRRPNSGNFSSAKPAKNTKTGRDGRYNGSFLIRDYCTESKAGRKSVAWIRICPQGLQEKEGKTDTERKGKTNRLGGPSNGIHQEGETRNTNQDR